jgi:hypothetical protein
MICSFPVVLGWVPGLFLVTFLNLAVVPSVLSLPSAYVRIISGRVQYTRNWEQGNSGNTPLR